MNFVTESEALTSWR